MKYGFIEQHRQPWPVRVQCTVLGVSASGFYDWLHRKPGPRARRRTVLADRIRQVHAASWRS